jgi:dTDP-4-amino-4,6-dideoxygalactose transaminase
VACNMDAIGEVARAAGVAIVEDNAHGLLGAYRGVPLGSLGDLATLSFHETKNFTCGEGGTLLVNREDLVERAEIVREKGTDRSRFFRGEVNKYRWVDIGSSELMSELQAAFLLAQLEARDAIQAQRAELWYRYRQELAEWALAVGAALPTVPEDCTPAHHLFHLLMRTGESRDRLIAHLAEREVQAVFHYLPLNDSPMGERLGGRPGDCPVAEEMSARLVRLPFFRGLAGAPQARVIEAVLEFDR